MSVPVIILLQAQADFVRYVPPEYQDELIEKIYSRLSRFPLIGTAMEPPLEFARIHGVGRWQVFYEPRYSAEEELASVNVLRVVPDTYASPPLFP